MRIGIFGGNFVPVNNAILFVADAALLTEGLERAQASAEHRCAMLLGAIAGNASFALDDSDVADGATGFTADLLPRIAQRYAGATFTFVIGADSLVNTPWVRFDEVLEALERFSIAPLGK